MFKSTKRRYMMIFVFITLVGVSGCNPLGGVSEAVDRAVDVIDRGIGDIQAESASWQSVLQRVADELPEDISETIRNDAQNLATRAVAATGAELRCNIDFLGNRAVAALRNLKAALLETTPDPLPPEFCQVAPDAIELSAAPDSWSRATLHGYDLDHTDEQARLFQVFLLDDAGNRSPLPDNRIGRTTHYQVTLNLGGLGPQLHEGNVVKLQVEWNGSTSGFPEIVVIPWQPNLRQEIHPLERTSYMPPHTRGDRDFNTHDDEHMSVDVRGELSVTDSEILSRVFMLAREERPDWTTVEGWSDWASAYTAPGNYEIIEVRPSNSSRHTANLTEHGEVTYSRPSGEVVDDFVVRGDHDGDEAGTWTNVEVHWRSVEITLQERAPEWLR